MPRSLDWATLFEADFLNLSIVNVQLIFILDTEKRFDEFFHDFNNFNKIKRIGAWYNCNISKLSRRKVKKGYEKIESILYLANCYPRCNSNGLQTSFRIRSLIDSSVKARTYRVRSSLMNFPRYGPRFS